MLNKNPKSRPSAKDILEHPWISPLEESEGSNSGLALPEMSVKKQSSVLVNASEFLA